MTPPSAPDSENLTPDDGRPVSGLTAAQAHELVAAGQGVLVDTRDRRLFDNAHAAGALSLPLATIEAAQGRPPAGALPPDRTLILYCAWVDERTSARAARLLIAAGHETSRVAVLLGGIRAWHQAGFPLQKWRDGA